MTRHSSHVVATGLFWLGVYLTLVLAPLFVLLIGPTPPGLGFWWDVPMHGARSPGAWPFSANQAAIGP